MSEILRRDFAELGRVEGWKSNLGSPEDRRRGALGLGFGQQKEWQAMSQTSSRQKSLFDLPVASGRGSLASQEAAERIVAGDVGKVHRERIYAALRVLPASTSPEIASYLNCCDPSAAYKFTPEAVAKRISELSKAGLVVTFGDRACEVKSGVLHTCWVVAGGCCSSPLNHVTGRIPGGPFESVQCRLCGKGLGKRRAVK